MPTKRIFIAVRITQFAFVLPDLALVLGQHAGIVESDLIPSILLSPPAACNSPANEPYAASDVNSSQF